jgi:hypothetical protein
MTPAEARHALQREGRGLVEIQPVAFASHLVALLCAVRPPPANAVDASGMARFACRINRPMWEAIKVLVDAHFAKSEKSQ